MPQSKDNPHVVIVGGGFGGLYAATALRRAPVRVTLLDKRNFHLFQPLLYQVATGGLSPGDICSPLRAVLQRQKNARVIMGEVTDVLAAENRVVVDGQPLAYDTLIVATGLQSFYFGHDEWAPGAPALKSLEDALEIRRRVLTAFETAEADPNPDVRGARLTFVVVGGGPTGVELAGALAELAHRTLRDEFSTIDPKQARILLLEGTGRLLPPYDPSLSAKAEDSLSRLGVDVRTSTLMTALEDGTLTIRTGDTEERIRADTVLWAAGMRATAMSGILAERAGAELDRMGRVIVEPDLSLAGYPGILVIGDLAHCVQNGQPLPGVAPVAMQQGRYAARLIKSRLKERETEPFRYRDRGSLAVIGRNSAVAQVAGLRISGFVAWVLWVFVHIAYLIGFDNKLLVLFQWAWNYFTRKRGARVITEGPF